MLNSTFPPDRAARRRLPRLGIRAAAALEFALVAPIFLAISLFTVDVARALLIWREVHNAALAIAENAEKLSVTVDPTSGLVTSELTYDQMQQAMSTVFAEIPGLNQGNGTGEFTGSLAVTLSSVWFYPLCQSANLSGCKPQTPYLRWSASLDPTYVGAGAQLTGGVVRPCTGGPLTPVAAFPDNATQYSAMVAPTMVLGGTPLLTAAPQIVADVRITCSMPPPALRRRWAAWTRRPRSTPTRRPTGLQIAHTERAPRDDRPERVDVHSETVAFR